LSGREKLLLLLHFLIYHNCDKKGLSEGLQGATLENKYD